MKPTVTRLGRCPWQPVSRAFLSPARVWRIQERSLHKSSTIFVEHALHVARINFEPKANSRALSTVGSVMSIGLSVNRCSHTKKPVWREKTRLTSPEVQAAGDLKDLTRFRKSLLFSSSLKKTKGDSSPAGCVNNCFRVVVVAVDFVSFLYWAILKK